MYQTVIFKRKYKETYLLSWYDWNNWNWITYIDARIVTRHLRHRVVVVKVYAGRFNTHARNASNCSSSYLLFWAPLLDGRTIGLIFIFRWSFRIWITWTFSSVLRFVFINLCILWWRDGNNKRKIEMNKGFNIVKVNTHAISCFLDYLSN